jgi:hypothetical protein
MTQPALWIPSEKIESDIGHRIRTYKSRLFPEFCGRNRSIHSFLGFLKITRSIGVDKFKMTFVFNIENHEISGINGFS